MVWSMGGGASPGLWAVVLLLADRGGEDEKITAVFPSISRWWSPVAAQIYGVQQAKIRCNVMVTMALKTKLAGLLLDLGCGELEELVFPGAYPLETRGGVVRLALAINGLMVASPLPPGRDACGEDLPSLLMCVHQ